MLENFDLGMITGLIDVIIMVVEKLEEFFGSIVIKKGYEDPANLPVVE